MVSSCNSTGELRRDSSNPSQAMIISFSQPRRGSTSPPHMMDSLVKYCDLTDLSLATTPGDPADQTRDHQDGVPRTPPTQYLLDKTEMVSSCNSTVELRRDSSNPSQAMIISFSQPRRGSTSPPHMMDSLVRYCDFSDLSVAKTPGYPADWTRDQQDGVPRTPLAQYLLDKNEIV